MRILTLFGWYGIFWLTLFTVTIVECATVFFICLGMQLKNEVQSKRAKR